MNQSVVTDNGETLHITRPHHAKQKSPDPTNRCQIETYQVGTVGFEPTTP